MTAGSWKVYLLVSALVLLIATPIGVRRFRIARTAAFCEAVGALPTADLADFASRCDLLMWERGGPGAEHDFIRDPKILDRFALVRRTPYEIVVDKGDVIFKYFHGHWSYSDVLIWGEDLDPRDGHKIRVLRIAYGSSGSRVLCERQGGHGERDGAANRSQPVHSEKIQDPARAGYGR